MDPALKEKFLEQWRRHFGEAELPLAFYYAGTEDRTERVAPPSGHQCLIGVLATVRKGKSLSFDVSSIGCAGGRRYTGFSSEMSPTFEFFLSCGIPGELEGERYKKSPEIVREMVRMAPKFKAPGPLIVFKRFDMLEEADGPEAVVFFAAPDVLSGLFTLANFDETEPNGVFCPFSAGCGSMVLYPCLEKSAERPRAVIGMFDISARPFVPKDTLTFAAPMNKFMRMVANMEESFLITRSWERVKKRIKES